MIIKKLACLEAEIYKHEISAKDHHSEEARREYLREHPTADPKRHTVQRKS